MLDDRQNPRRNQVAPLVAGVTAALVTLLVGYLLFSRSSAPAPVAQTHKEMLECLVCKQAVDPATTQFKLTYHGQKIYFDRQECLDAFVAEPRKFGHVKVDVKPDTSSPDVTEDSPAPVKSATSGEAEIEPSTSAAPETEESSAPADDSPATPETEESAEPATDSDATRDPHPPPLHQAPSGAPSSSEEDAPTDKSSAAPTTDDDVPQPPPNR